MNMCDSVCEFICFNQIIQYWFHAAASGGNDFIMTFIFGLFLRRMNKNSNFLFSRNWTLPHKYLFLSQTCVLSEVVHWLKHCAIELMQKYDLELVWNDRLCGLVVRVLGYRSGTTKKNVVGLEQGPLSPVSTTEELLDRKVAAPV
jgi:hypothetical protein